MTTTENLPLATTALDDLTLKQLEVLRETGTLPPEELTVIEGTNFHSYMVDGRAYTDGTFLIFIDEETSPRSQTKFLYYMGAENEAVILARYQGVTIYEGVSESRLSR